ncbi:hypothetical protein OGH69_06920 [Flavobacterium sp. MFBS3-15]|uniref:hypothetical protein n=1 Tax=Flavobacterium sp. MFBS3-15 TaxID=2989816 RepID=UPI0022366299|nr:hypothetical protein [Flavobacterium sp. MFBS3-15]MCW4468687.1 hypothetical protein [Flavobacterium sp. MFBS3-15]
MKKFNLIPAILLAFSPLFINAQINQTPMHSGGAQGQIMVKAESAMPATGSMYTDDRFMPAKTSGNEQIILVKYNAYSDYFEMNNPQQGTTQILPKQTGSTVTMTGTGEVYAFQKYKTEKGEEINGYLNVVSDNSKVKIYKREKIYLQPGKIAQDSYHASKPATYKRADDEFYVKINDGEITYVSNKKDIANLVPGKSKEVLDFIKKNKIDVEEAKDLQELSGFIESIL